ncbi:hypothetical protein B0H13DRAFT_2378117 [Mycena leptocephala]|nr:hypothetical protein B0H13DRAFT_2378117 [Mycena leptocephala]
MFPYFLPNAPSNAYTSPSPSSFAAIFLFAQLKMHALKRAPSPSLLSSFSSYLFFSSFIYKNPHAHTPSPSPPPRSLSGHLPFALQSPAQPTLQSPNARTNASPSFPTPLSCALDPRIVDAASGLVRWGGDATPHAVQLLTQRERCACGKEADASPSSPATGHEKQAAEASPSFSDRACLLVFLPACSPAELCVDDSISSKLSMCSSPSPSVLWLLPLTGLSTSAFRCSQSPRSRSRSLFTFLPFPSSTHGEMQAYLLFGFSHIVLISFCS